MYGHTIFDANLLIYWKSSNYQTTSLLGYSISDLKKDTALLNNSGSQSKKSPLIDGNNLIDKNDTFLIKSISDTTCFVQSIDSKSYRVYRIFWNK